MKNFLKWIAKSLSDGKPTINYPLINTLKKQIGDRFNNQENKK